MKNTRKIRQTMTAVLAVILLVAADLLSKNAAEALRDNPNVLIPGVFELRYFENHGAAFSILENGTVFFIIFTTVFLILLMALLIRLQKRKIPMLKTALVMIIAGGIGNLIDRVIHGFVIDLFHFGFFEFPIFNFADTLITIGAVLLFVFVLFFYEKYFPDKKKKDRKNGEPELSRESPRETEDDADGE